MLPTLVLCIVIRAVFWRPRKKVANSHVGVTVKRRQKRPKIHVHLLLFLLLLLLLLRHTFLSRQFLGNYYRHQHK